MRYGDHRHVPMVQVDDRTVEAVGPTRTVRTSRIPVSMEHEMIDDQLTPAIEQLRQSLFAIGTVELVFLLDRLPSQRPTRLAQLVAQPAESLLLGEKAPCEPRATARATGLGEAAT